MKRDLLDLLWPIVLLITVIGSILCAGRPRPPQPNRLPIEAAARAMSGLNAASPAGRELAAEIRLEHERTRW